MNMRQFQLQAQREDIATFVIKQRVFILMTYHTNMGIPFYFATLLKNHAGITTVVKQMDVDVLGIDFNCLIHRYLKDDNPIQSVLDALEHIVSQTCNAKQIFIAFDGLVPYAKIVQS